MYQNIHTRNNISTQEINARAQVYDLQYPNEYENYAPQSHCRPVAGTEGGST